MPASLRYLSFLERVRAGQGMPPFTGEERKRAVEKWLNIARLPPSTRFDREAEAEKIRRLASASVVLLQCRADRMGEARASLLAALPLESIESVTAAGERWL
jgi:hypothetical protein